LIDLWSQTSASCSKASRMPFVENWLYGKRDDIFETGLAWRKEVEFLALPGVSQTDREAALERYRVLPQETLKEPTYRLRDKLLAFPASGQDERLLFQGSDGAVHACAVRELADETKWTDYDLADGVVLLPVGCGWLSHGMLRAKEADGRPGDDVADSHDEGDSESEAACRCRYLAERDESGWSVGILGEPDSADGLPDWKNGLDRKGGRLLKVSLPREDEGGKERFLIFQTNIGRPNRAAQEEVTLKTHLEDVEAKAREIARLALPGREEAYGLAGRIHDDGKDCELWQKAMGGDPRVPLAKTKRPANPKLLKGFRHELRSLLTALENSQTDDLFLHLVASHHGWARPYWEKTAYDKDRSTEKNAGAAMEAARRFSRLQDEWGPWGLAYLEALFKAADGMASRQEEGVSDG
jgi:CRISPR-associated endonuclease/helicase Cas3